MRVVSKKGGIPLVDRSRISKLLSLILRHRPDEFGLNIDAFGFIPVDEVVEVVQERYDEATDEAVRDLVADTSQHRFEIVDERIRALYGHSFFVEMDGDPMDPPEKLYMGTTAKAGSRMEANGIHPVDRSYLHLSMDYDSAKSRSREAGTPCVAEIQAKKAFDDGGIEFFARGEVVLTREIPPEFVGQVHGLAEAGPGQAVSQAPCVSSPKTTPPAQDDGDQPQPAAFGRRPRRATGRRG